MYQLYPLSGPTTSCASQDFDFLNYWVDKTVEKEIKRGKKLQELKKPQSVRKEKYDVIHMGRSDLNCEKKRSERRRKSPIRAKKGRRRSPRRKYYPTNRKVSKKKSSRQQCSMRIAELSVPSKRQCIDTWRNKYHVLPGIMIDRLRQHVLDLSPVVKIPDAIECFKRHKYSKKRKCKNTKEIIRKNHNLKNDDAKTSKKHTRTNECKYLCAYFGHKIAKQLMKPVTITLNPELEKISNVVSVDIEKLVNNGKKCDKRYITNQIMHTEVAAKVSIWIKNILDESAYKILEDQLIDLEEEIGPVLDFIDGLIDNVADICEPEPEIIEVVSSSDTYYNISTEYNYEEDIAQINEFKEQEENMELENIQDEESFTVDDNIPVNADFLSDEEPIEVDLDDFIKKELDDIINSFDGDMPINTENIVFEDIANSQPEPNKTSDTEDKEQNEFVDANDSFDVEIDQPTTNRPPQAEILEGDPEAVEVKEIPSITDHELDADKSKDPENESPNDKLSEDDNKKVKFSSNIVNAGTTGQEIISKKSSDQVFSPPNDHLLSDADETWPEDITSTILKPSESVSKSITSLGQIIEAEEKGSVSLDDNAKVKEIVKQVDKNDDFKQLDDNADISIDTSIGTKTQDGINETQNISAIETDQENINEITNSSVDTVQPNKANKTSNEGTIDTMQYNDIGETVNNESVDTKELYNKNEQRTDSEIVSKVQEFEEERPESFVKDPNKIRKDLNKLTDEVRYRSSTDSTFDHHVPIGNVAYENTLDNILEGEATQETAELDEILEGEVSQEVDKLEETVINESGTESAAKFDTIYKESNKLHVMPEDEISQREATLDRVLDQEGILEALELEKQLEEEATVSKITDTKKVEIQTSNKAINTSFSLIPREDKCTSVVSQSLGDLTKHFQGGKPDMFSSVRIKPKVDYKVHKKTAPSWVTQHYGEPSEPLIKSQKNQKKETNDKNIRLWCKDLENGFENLELWNNWISKTAESVRIMERKKARICIDKTREEFVRDWLQLKNNVEADVITWTKLSKSTQEKLKCFRNIYQNFETQADNTCNYPK